MDGSQGPKAIETRYAGHRFRSRLEARWAVFMDTLGVKYEYEPQGFELTIDPYFDGPRTVRYLPDFWLPDLQAYMEVKGPEPSTEERCKAEALAMGTGHPVYVFNGECWLPEWMESRKHRSQSAQVYSRQTWRLDGADGWSEEVMAFSDLRYWWCVCPFCEAISIEREGDAARMPCGCVRKHNGGVLSSQITFWYPRIVAALTAARSARFEFGEKGR